MILTVAEIRIKMKDRSIQHIARVTKLHPNTLRAIKNGKRDSVTTSTLEKLNRYFMGSRA